MVLYIKMDPSEIEVIEAIKNKILEVQAEFCQTLRKKYTLYPFVCDFGSNALLGYLKHVLPDLIKSSSVNFGWYQHPNDSDACGNHSWIQISFDELKYMIIDPTYEQFDESYKDRIRIVDGSNVMSEYKLYEASPIIGHFTKRAENTKTLAEYLYKFKGRKYKTKNA